MRALLVLLAVLPALLLSRPSFAADWRTPAEASRFTRTPSYAETRAYFERLKAAAPTQIAINEFGVSPEGRALFNVVIASGGEFTPPAAHASGKPVLLIQACIHPGENEGKDALMALARDWLIEDQQASERAEVVLVLLPIFSVDGHENVGPHRINQNGPDETGWRSTAQNYNLNRDFLKVESPEMRAWQAHWQAWNPDLLVDMHNTNGADYQYHLTYAYERHASVHEGARQWQKAAFDTAIPEALKNKGWLLAPYFDQLVFDDPRRGIAWGASTPRFSSGFGAAANRPTLLLETHMLKDFKTRTEVNEDYIAALVAHVAADPAALKTVNQGADAVAAALAGKPYTLRFKLGDKVDSTEFLGFQYERVPSEVSGALWTRYSAKPERIQVPLKQTLEPETTVALPHGYLIPASWTAAIKALQTHGVRFVRIQEAITLEEADTYRFSDVTYAPQPFEGRVRVASLNLTPVRESLSFPVGSVLVPLDQPRNPIIAHLLEPAGPDSLVRMGYGDGFMTQTEYVEPRVMERMAREMMAADPMLKAAFEAELQRTEFAADAAARLRFFYRRLPHYDERHLRYPVARLRAEQLGRLSP